MSAQSQSEMLIFMEALRLPAEARSDYINRACAGDENRRLKVQALLRANDKAGQFLEKLPSAFAGERVQQIGAIEKPGDWIGRYKLLQQIGEGGWGIVFLAEQKDPVRRQVALKVIKPGMDTKSVIARFETERQALALMDHPHIAHVLDAGATETGRPFFVMELVRGIKITEYCDQNSLAARERMELFIQVCGAIQYAHQKGIIHRDIKPSNILVDAGPDGKAFPKVIDFGIVKATTNLPPFDKTLLTGNEMMIGTPDYMSPEQAAHLDIDTRTDIYSLGALLYELLTGTTPFDSRTLRDKSLDEIRRIISSEDPPRPSARLKAMSAAEQRSLARRQRADFAKLIREVRGDLDWIVMKALEKDRARRFATANELAMDVHRYLFNETVVARPPSRVYKFRKLVLRNKLAFAGIALITLFLTVGLIVVSAALSTERQARRQAQAEAAKSKLVTAILVDSVQEIDPGTAAGEDKTMLRGILDGVARRLDTGLTNQPEVEAELRVTIGAVYRQIGLFDRAEVMDRSALAIYRTLSPPNSPQTASALNELGLGLISRAKLPEAEQAETESLAIRRRLFGDSSLEAATSMHDLAHVDMDEGKYGEAESLSRQSLAIRQKLLDPESLEVADSLRNLTVVLGDQRKWAEAEDTAQKVLAIRRKRLGLEHPEVTSAMLDLAWVEESRGKSAEAQATKREAFKINAKVLPETHPDIAISVSWLGNRLRQRGDLEDADTALNMALAMQRTEVGEDNPATLSTLLSLGWTLEGENKLSEAEGAFRHYLAPRERHESPALPAQEGLAHVLVAEHKFHGAEEFLNQTLTPEMVQKPSSADLVNVRVNLLARQGRFREAAPDAMLVVKYKPSGIIFYHPLAGLLAVTGDRPAYSNLCREIITTATNVTGSYQAMCIALDCLILPDGGVDPIVADKFADKALILGKNDGSLPDFQACKALSEYRLGHFAEAIEWSQKPLKSYSDYARGKAYSVLAMAQWRLGRPDIARTMLSAAEKNVPDALKAPAPDLGPEWNTWLFARLHVNEAEKLIASDLRADNKPSEQ